MDRVQPRPSKPHNDNKTLGPIAKLKLVVVAWTWRRAERRTKSAVIGDLNGSLPRSEINDRQQLSKEKINKETFSLETTESCWLLLLPAPAGRPADIKPAKIK